MTKFVKQNTEPIAVEFVEDEHEESKDYAQSFWFENERHYFEDFEPVSAGECDFLYWKQDDGTRESYENPMYVVWFDDSHINIYRKQEV